jgi:hypothetical protein
MGNGIDEAAINQAESRARESCTQAQTIGAVTNDQRRIACGAAHVLAVDDCDRNTLAVGRSRTDLIKHIAMAIKPTARRIPLAQGQRAGRHVEVVNALGLNRTAEMEAQHRCGWIEIGFVVVQEGARGDADCGWPRHRNFAELWDGEYADCRPSFVFHVYSHECLKRFEMTEMMPWLLWNDLPPMRRRRRCLRCAHQPEVRRVKISADEELVAYVIDFIDHASPARLNDLQLCGRVIDGQIAKLAGALLTDAD